MLKQKGGSKKPQIKDTLLAQNSLRIMYAEDRGVPQDDEQSQYWFNKACHHVANAVKVRERLVANDLIAALLFISILTSEVCWYLWINNVHVTAKV